MGAIYRILLSLSAFWAASSVLSLSTPEEALAQENAPTSHQAPGIVFSFEGGVVGDNIAAVLQHAFEIGTLGTKRYTVQPNDSICKIVQTLGYPPPCNSIIKLINSLNPSSTRAQQLQLSPGDTIAVPDINIDSYKTGKMLSKEKGDVVQRELLLKNWKRLNPAQVDRSPSTWDITYTGYDFFLPTKDDESSAKLEAKVLDIASSNVLVDVLRQSPVPTQVHSPPVSTEQYQSLCLQGHASGIVYNYRELSDYEFDALTTVQALLQARAPLKVPVYLIDVDLLPAPNLYPAYGVNSPPVAWDCNWAEFHRGINHATFLAGYIDGENAAYGFKGLAPSVSIVPFRWAKPKSDGSDDLEASSPDRALNLADTIIQGSFDNGPRGVYVAATDFDAWNRPMVNGQLANADVRFTRKLEKTIKDRRPMLVVAAGEAQSDKEMPIALSPTAPEFPQNLGDLQNVIVVTACDPCSRNNPKLMPAANYGTGERKFVHVAAPGSLSPGWISDRSIGATSGTSESTAYVAGILASMVSYYPESYLEPAALKSRVQVTSRPLPRWIGGYQNSDVNKIAAGIVDPVLALLDPTVHWLKEGKNYRPVKIQAWSSETLQFQDPDNSQLSYVTAKAVRRVLRMSSDQSSSISIYSDRSLDQASPQDGDPGEVRLLSPVALTQKMTATVTLCDAPSRTNLSTKKLAEIEDLIIAIAGVGNNECGVR